MAFQVGDIPRAGGAAKPGLPAGGPVALPSSAQVRVKARFPEKFRPLLETHARYKVFYGGRGGAKSWQFARALLLRGMNGGLRVLCTRETQSSLKESVMQLLADQIKLMGLGNYYKVLKAEIRGPDGTLFIFKGLSDPDALKSAEGVDVMWIEEARMVSETSWKKFDPTIRKPGAEIWISMNPELETDWLYKLFVKGINGKPPPNSIVVKVGYKDNPWLDKAIVEQAKHLRETDFDEYLWVYGGHCRTSLDGAVYSKELRRARAEERITRVPIARERPVHTFWDLGRGDMTAIWFVQIVGLEYRVVAYYQNSGEHISHYLDKLEELRQEKGWTYGTCWLPHDAEHELLGQRRTIKVQVADAGYRVKITPDIKIADGINAARTIFGACWFDEEACEDGIAALRQYHYDIDPQTNARSLKPEHDWSSHGADGFRYMGVALKDDGPAPKVKPKAKPRARSGRSGWMAR